MKEVLYTLSPGQYQQTLFVKVNKNKETGNSPIDSAIFINHMLMVPTCTKKGIQV